jgi:hypothetical protein
MSSDIWSKQYRLHKVKFMCLPDLFTGDGINLLAFNAFPANKVLGAYESGNTMKAPGRFETNVDSLAIRAILEQEAVLLFLLQQQRIHSFSF